MNTAVAHGDSSSTRGAVGALWAVRTRATHAVFPSRAGAAAIGAGSRPFG